MTPYREFKNFRDNNEGRVFSEDGFIDFYLTGHISELLNKISVLSTFLKNYTSW